MKKNIHFYWPNIIESVAIAIIATIMFIIFARTKATGDSNLIWIVVFAVFDVLVIITTIYDLIDPMVKQLALTAPYVFLLIDQYCLIYVGKISETCCNYWWNFSIGLAICIFNNVICAVEEDFDDDAAASIAFCSSIVIIRYIQLLVRHLI